MSLHAVSEHLLDIRRKQVTQEFDSLEKFAAVFILLPEAIKKANKLALNQAANIIKKDCREQIGEYQSAVGNYPEWAPLAESTEDQKANMGAPADAPLLRFGDLKKSFRSTPDGHDAIIIGSTDPVMEYHEFGTSKMPPRPVLGPALLKNMEVIKELLDSAVVTAIVAGQRMGYRFNEDVGIGE